MIVLLALVAIQASNSAICNHLYAALIACAHNAENLKLDTLEHLGSS